MKQEYLMLAHTFSKAKHNIGGWYASEKLDGSRAFWDGGCSRGLPAMSVPYANIIKDDRLKVSPIATGLWSRSGKVIHAPDWWLEELPDCPLDGELYLGRGRFQELRKIVGQHTPDLRWVDVAYRVFDSPAWETFNQDREIKIRNEYKFWVTQAAYSPCWRIKKNWTFELVRHFLEKQCLGSLVASVLKQERLPLGYHQAVARVTELLDQITEDGGEGLVLRNPSSYWVPERSHNLLKVKKWKDAEGKLVGYTAGKGKYQKMIGALILDFNGKRLELSGLTDDEREFFDSESQNWASANPGQDMPDNTFALYFKNRQQITFKYRELSDSGTPKEARYWRKT